MSVGKARAGGWIAAAVVAVISWGVSTACPALAADAQPVPQSTVGDVAALSPSERAAFLRGYLTALAAFDVGSARCLVTWFYDKGGAADLERTMLALNAEPPPSAKPADPDGGPGPEFYKAQPMAMMLQMKAFDYCANQK